MNVAKNERKQSLTERVISGRGSLIRKREREGFFLGIHAPVTKSNPSYGGDQSTGGTEYIGVKCTCLAPSKKLFFRYLIVDL